MLKLLFLLPVGVFSHSLLPTLPPVHWLYLLVVLALVFSLIGRWGRAPAVLIVGFAIGGLWASEQMKHRLPVALDKTDVTVVGTVTSLVVSNGARKLFHFHVDNVEQPAGSTLYLLKNLRISWYGQTAIQPGETWRLHVRLRSPRGFSNPGGFDYSAWLLSENISATGYVRQGPGNGLISKAPAWSLHNVRHQLLSELLEWRSVDEDVVGIMAALILGEQGLIPGPRFRQLELTATIHLVVVSGLHIGMVCALGYAIGLVVGRFAVALGALTPARILAIPIALGATVSYSVLAGFELPIQRALIMTSAALLALSLRRSMHIWTVVGLALSIISLIDPLAVMSSGFWLSFMAVFGLLGWFSFRPPTGRSRRLISAQVVVFICLAPWLIGFQGTVSLWSLPVNLVAIPWVGMFIVPCCLLGALFRFIPVAGDLFWSLASWQIEYLLRLLSWIELNYQFAGLSPLIHLPAGNLAVVIALVCLALLVLAPRGLGKGAPVVILLAAIVALRQQPGGALELAVLDVGQGLATVVRAGDRVMVYDAGPGYPSGFNTGEAVVTPYLNTLGINTVDLLVVSHGDTDHAGGVQGLMENKRVTSLLSGQPERLAYRNVAPCQQGTHWQWGNVSFRVIWPLEKMPASAPDRENNNLSCVLLVEMGQIRILLPGDIEKKVEAELLRGEHGAFLEGITLVIAPHHGSKSSSSPAFVTTMAPEHVIFSAGLNHHFGHPHPVVLRRYEKMGTHIWRTAESGALIFRWDAKRELSIYEHRKAYRRYWH